MRTHPSIHSANAGNNRSMQGHGAHKSVLERLAFIENVGVLRHRPRLEVSSGLVTTLIGILASFNALITCAITSQIALRSRHARRRPVASLNYRLDTSSAMC